MFLHEKYGPLVDATPARENLAPMVAMGVSASFIYQLTGVSNQLVARIMAGRATARQHHVETLAGLSMQTVIDADPLVHIGDVRDRINHSSRAGWSHAYIAEQAGLPRSQVSTLAVGTTRRSRLSILEPLREVLDVLEATGPRAEATMRAGGFTDATPAREHVKKLLDYGIRVCDIATVSGVSYPVVRDVANGRYRTVKHINAEAILGTSISAIARRDPMVSLGKISSQVRRLNLQGWSQEYLAREIGIHQTTLSSWQTGRSQTARLSTVRRFQALYAQLDGTPGPHAMSAHIVEAKRPAMLRKRQERAAERQRTKTDQGRGAAA